MDVHLVDGTYELFRHHFGMPSRVNGDGQEVAATRGVVRSMLGLLEGGATHVGVATDHVIESWRNDLWPGYKDGSGVAPELRSQFGLLEDALTALGVAVWAMVEDEADDALASAAAVAAADDRVDRVEVMTPDKDLGQTVGGKVVQVDRRKSLVLDAEGVRAKFGVDPSAIPDYLALVGDAADGFPGLKGWGASSAATVLGHYGSIDAIPDDPGEWAVSVHNGRRLASTLAANREQASLFRLLATLRTDSPVGVVDDWCWGGTGPGLDDLCDRLELADVPDRAARLAASRSAEPGGPG